MALSGVAKRSIILAATLSVLWFLFLTGRIWSHPPVWPDEAIFAAISDNLARRGVFGSLLYRDFIPHSEKYTLWYPPVYFILEAFVFRIFGPGLVPARTLSVTVSGLTIFILYLLLSSAVRNPWIPAVSAGMLFTDVFFRSGSVIARMEIIAALFGFTGFFALYIRSPWRYTVAGILFSLGLMTHPMGILFPVAAILGGTAPPHRIGKIAAIVGPSVLLFCTWIVMHLGVLDVMRQQLAEQSLRKYYLTPYLSQLLQFKKDQFLLLASYTILSLVPVFLIRKLPGTVAAVLAWYAAITPWFVFGMKEMWYLSYLSLSAAVGVTFLIGMFWKQRREILIPVFVLLAFLILNTLIRDTLSQRGGEPAYDAYGSVISKALPANASLLISVIPDPYFYIAGHRTDIAITESPNSPPAQPIDSDRYNRVFGKVDYAVISYFGNESIAGYLDRNTERVLTQGRTPTGDPFTVIKLKHMNDRIPFGNQP